MKFSKLKYIAAALTVSMLVSSVSLAAFALNDSANEAADPDVEIVEDTEEEDAELENPEEDEETDVILDDDTSESDTDEEEPIIVPAETTASLPEPTYEPVSEMTLYADQSINVRLGPSTNYGIFGGLSGGESVKVIGKSGDWYAVSFLGGTGYIRSDLLSSTAPAATTTAAQTTAAPATEAVPEETTQAVAEVIEPDEPATEPPVTDEPAPAETTAAEPEAVVTEASEETTSAPEETGSEETEDKAAGTAIVSGPMALLIALGGALIVFFLIGLLPIIIHKVHHNKLYQY